MGVREVVLGRSLGVAGGLPVDAKNRGASFGASWGGPGKLLGRCWRYGAILGSVSRDQIVAISVIFK